MWISALLARAGTAILPAGPVRERYRQEFRAEMVVMTRSGRLAYAFGILANSLVLRAAVAGEYAPVAERDFARVRKPLLCRLHLHFRVRCVNEDHDVYHRCRRCGDDQYEYELHADPTNVEGAIISGGFSGPW